MEHDYAFNYEQLTEARAALVEDNNWLTRMDLREAVTRSAKLYDYEKGAHYQAMVIADCFALHFDVTLPIIMPDVAHAEEIELFLRFLRKTELIIEFTQKPENQQVLAAIIVYRAHLAEIHQKTMDNTCIRDFLEQWTGRPYSLDALSSEKTMVDILYGPGVWDIYLDQGDLRSFCIRQLYTLAPAVNCHSEHMSTNKAVVYLPNDLNE